MADFFYLLARVTMPLVFIVAGIGGLMNVTGYANTLAAKGIPQAAAAGYVIVAFQLVAGVLLVVGFKARWAALALMAFTAGTIFMAHHFWDMEGVARALNQTQALKNLAIMAGLLLFVLMGAGRYSVDGRDP